MLASLVLGIGRHQSNASVTYLIHHTCHLRLKALLTNGNERTYSGIPTFVSFKRFFLLALLLFGCCWSGNLHAQESNGVPIAGYLLHERSQNTRK